MKSKLKKWLSLTLLITGLITSITGALESIGKLIRFIQGSNKSIDVPISPLEDHRGLLLMLIGIIMIIIHEQLIKTK